MEISYRHLATTTDDGVKLAVQTVGEGPTIILANGIGVRYTGMAPLVESLRRDYRLILWDYRGIGHSRTSDEEHDFSIGRHASDGLTILEQLGVKRAVVLGWSMGVPVGLEMIRREPERIAGFGALFGSPGNPFRAGFPAPVALAMQSLFRFSLAVPLPSQLLLDLSATLPSLTYRLLSSTWFVGKDCDRSILASNVEGIADVPKRPYYRTMLELAEHDARDILSHVRCPTLVVAGTRDWLTPPSAAREMANAIPQAELLIMERATHFGLVEQVPQLLEAIRGLLARVGEGW